VPNPNVSGGKLATFTSQGTASNLENWAVGKGGDKFGGYVDALGPKASEIFEERSATGVWESHQEIALLNIGGGNDTNFSENENLYGFSIFKFNKGILGGGWANANMSSLLAMDLSGVLGEDPNKQASSYFFNLHPKAINLSEPFATQIIPTQGGGVYTESQGVILRTLSITGTTGYRPSLANVSPTSKDGTIPWTPGEPTGYLNFLKLRNVFRNYSDLKRDQSLAYKVYMVWFNNREQEAWFFEPSAFTTSRDASSPFTYTYSISGTLIQKVNFSSVVNTIHPDPTSPHFQIATMRRAASMLNGIMSLWFPDLGDDIVGDVMKSTRVLLQAVDDLDNTITNLATTGAGITQSVVLLVGTISTTVASLRTSLDKLQDNPVKLWGPNANVEEWADNYSNQYKMFVDAAYAMDTLQKSVVKIAQPELLTQVAALSSPASKGSSTGGANTATGKASLALGGASQAYLEDPGTAWTGVPVPDSDVDLSDLVESLVGDPAATAAVITYNDLDYPYITGTPAYQKGANKVLTKGDVLYLPFPKELVSGDINTKINPLKSSLSLYQEVLGRDLKLTKSTHGTTGVSEFNLSISPNGDLDLIAGEDNIKQAIEIKLNVERGELTIHPEFGLIPVMGKKGTKVLNFDLYLSLNDTMLSDGRIKDLVDTRVKTTGDVVSVQTKVYVIGQVPYVPLSFTLGG
jgi:hypothetical protein